MNILIVVTSNPFSKDFDSVYKLSKALVGKADVTIFLSGNGAYWLSYDMTKQFLDIGVKIIYCAHSARQRDIEESIKSQNFISSSSYDMFRKISEFDKVINFN
jgi:sulfur relay (sulfurtransferase) complex TusBCD TusD component (DsrE family)